MPHFDARCERPLRFPTARRSTLHRSRRMEGDETSKRIGVLTGGGDVPGLNAVIKSVVYRSTRSATRSLGIRRGWEGLTHLRSGTDARSALISAARPPTPATIDRTGGTILHTSRTNPRKMRAAGLPSLDRSKPNAPRYASR